MAESSTSVHIALCGNILDPLPYQCQQAVTKGDARRGSGSPRISFQDIHGGSTAVIRAADLRLERFLSEEDLRSVRSAAAAAQLPAHPEVALLTGANGFLGRFLLLELLQAVSKQQVPLTLPTTP